MMVKQSSWKAVSKITPAWEGSLKYRDSAKLRKLADLLFHIQCLDFYTHTHIPHEIFLKLGSVMITSNIYFQLKYVISHLTILCNRKESLQNESFLLLLLLISKERRSCIPEITRTELHRFLKLPADFKGLYWKINQIFPAIHTLVI